MPSAKRKRPPAKKDPLSGLFRLWDRTAKSMAGTRASGRLPAESRARPPARWQDDIIVSVIPRSASVLDLGCGEGLLLDRLAREKQVRGQGVELDADAVFACVDRGVPVFQADIDAGLKGFPDESFDYVVLEETLPTVRRPLDVLREMLRVGRRGIVSFPNFAFWRVRMDLAVRGRMPLTAMLPHPWYASPNIHLFSLQDFLDWVSESGLRLADGRVYSEGKVRKMRDSDNLLAEEALLVVEKKR
jgi:methionine biosynthesis protein MetW